MMRGARQSGFSLIEVLVAFVLLAGGLGLLLGILSGGLSQVRWAQAHSEAMLVARSALDTVGTVEPVRPGRFEGEADDGRYRWVMAIEPWEESEATARFDDPETVAAPVRLYRVDLDLYWGEGGPRERVRMSTLRGVRGDAGFDEPGFVP